MEPVIAFIFPLIASVALASEGNSVLGFYERKTESLHPLRSLLYSNVLELMTNQLETGRKGTYFLEESRSAGLLAAVNEAQIPHTTLQTDLARAEGTKTSYLQLRFR